jgi:hypothetical protein
MFKRPGRVGDSAEKFTPPSSRLASGRHELSLIRTPHCFLFFGEFVDMASHGNIQSYHGDIGGAFGNGSVCENAHYTSIN